MPIVSERQPGDGRPPAQYQAAEHVVAEMADSGARRLQVLSALQILVLAMLAGAFVTAGALFSVLLSVGIESPGLQHLVEGLGFSAGFFFVILRCGVVHRSQRRAAGDDPALPWLGRFPMAEVRPEGGSGDGDVAPR